ncbi:MAG TPA: acyclic terpene utilization AtuA family protein [Terracidiphilus sp.]|nr:acyclic terpene utilization AtuA family protein [Terracidiphilus sp.]
MQQIRIGTGAGYSGDRIDPAVELCEKGSISYLVFECLAERTIALAQKARRLNPSSGFDPLLEERMRAVLPLCTSNHIRIISNMGAANPIAAMDRTRDIARSLGLKGLKIAAVTGDDVLPEVRGGDFIIAENGQPVSEMVDRLVSANAYLGLEPILEALASGADIVLTGRVADPSLFLAAMVHEFGWSLTDWNLLGQGTAIAHLLECGGQVTGGYFADPEYKNVPNLARLGFPIAEVLADGSAEITKVQDSGGLVTKSTCIEQLLYEIEDPSTYQTPDVVADFSQIIFDAVGANRVSVLGGRGTLRPDNLKVSVGFQDGFVGEGQISYAGPGALRRAKLAVDILSERLGWHSLQELRFDLIGVNSIHGSRVSKMNGEPYEVRLRAVGRVASEAIASLIPREVEALYTNGPAGGGGVSGSTKETLGILSTYIPRHMVAHHVYYEES